MKKFYVLIFLLIIITTKVFCQEIVGKWYAINRSGLIEFNLSKDTIGVRTMYSDLRTKGSEKDKTEHAGIFKLENKFLIAIPDKKKVNQYRAMTFFNFKNGESIEIAANGINVSGTIEQLINQTRADTTTLHGNIIYSEKFISVLRSMKDIELMTLQDFKMFLKNLIKEKSNSKDLKDNMAGTQSYQLITRLLFEMGYNPINGIDVVDRHFEKFVSDPEVKELLKQM